MLTIFKPRINFLLIYRPQILILSRSMMAAQQKTMSPNLIQRLVRLFPIAQRSENRNYHLGLSTPPTSNLNAKDTSDKIHEVVRHYECQKQECSEKACKSTEECAQESVHSGTFQDQAHISSSHSNPGKWISVEDTKTKQIRRFKKAPEKNEQVEKIETLGKVAGKDRVAYKYAIATWKNSQDSNPIPYDKKATQRLENNEDYWNNLTKYLDNK